MKQKDQPTILLPLHRDMVVVPLKLNPSQLALFQAAKAHAEPFPEHAHFAQATMGSKIVSICSETVKWNIRTERRVQV